MPGPTPSMNALAAGLAALALCAAPANAGAPDAETFAAAFGEVCIPERLSYDGTRALAERIGWQKSAPGDDPALDSFLANAVEMLEKESAEDPDFVFENKMEAFVRAVGGRRTYLVVDLFLSEVIDLVSCYLYDFSATEPMDAEPVSRLLGQTVAYGTDGGDPGYAVDPAELVSTVWGPPPALPRTGDTYLTFIPPGSPHATRTGFTGLVLKFSTSLPREEP